jgi:hypothetical protein
VFKEPSDVMRQEKRNEILIKNISIDNVIHFDE